MCIGSGPAQKGRYMLKWEKINIHVCKDECVNNVKMDCSWHEETEL